MIKITDNFRVNKPDPIDDRLGPFTSTASALSSIELVRRYIGLTVIVDTGSGATEYWFEDGIQNNNLVVKSSGGGSFNCADLLTCTDFTDLQTDVSNLQTDVTNLQTDIGNLVPYTGANQDVDLGTNNLNAKSVKINGTAGNGHLGLKHQSSNATAQGQETALFAGSDGELYYKNDGLTLAQIASRAWVNAQGFITNVITALGFTPENVANKQTDLTASATNYPTVNAVNTGLGTKVNANSAITGATKTKITYDSKGLVTAGADITIADIPTTLPVAYSAPVVSIVSGGVITETQLTTITIPAGAFKNGDNILSTFWATRTSGAATGVNTAIIVRITNGSGTQIVSVSTGNRHNNFNLNARVLSDTSIIWWPNSATATAVTTTTPSLASSGFTVYIGVTRTNTTDEVTLYNSIIRKYS